MHAIWFDSRNITGLERHPQITIFIDIALMFLIDVMVNKEEICHLLTREEIPFR